MQNITTHSSNPAIHSQPGERAGGQARNDPALLRPVLTSLAASSLLADQRLQPSFSEDIYTLGAQESRRVGGGPDLAARFSSEEASRPLTSQVKERERAPLDEGGGAMSVMRGGGQRAHFERLQQAITEIDDVHEVPLPFTSLKSYSHRHPASKAAAAAADVLSQDLGGGAGAAPFSVSDSKHQSLPPVLEKAAQRKDNNLARTRAKNKEPEIRKWLAHRSALPPPPRTAAAMTRAPPSRQKLKNVH